MNLKKLFINKPKQSIEKIINLSKENPLAYKQLFDYEMKKFGVLTLKELIKEYDSKRIHHEDINIEPLNIIAASHHPHFCNIPMINFYYNKEKRYKFNEHFSKSNTYFFSKINQIDSFEAMKFYIINDKNGYKKYIVRHGHHRSVTAYFLQLLDKAYKLKSIEAIEYKIDWNSINTKNKYMTLFNKKKYFDYDSFEEYM